MYNADFTVLVSKSFNRNTKFSLEVSSFDHTMSDEAKLSMTLSKRALPKNNSHAAVVALENGCTHFDETFQTSAKNTYSKLYYSETQQYIVSCCSCNSLSVN